MTTPDIEARVRALIDRMENRPPDKQPPATPRDHWLACGKDEAYDNVLGWLYAYVLLEER